MGWFSIFRKNKQEPDSSEAAFLSRAEEESNAVRGRGKRKQGNQPADPVLPEKKRARRRLVGAIALVLAMIIGLPMIFDSEPKPLADDIAIQIPSKDKASLSAMTHPDLSAAASAVAAGQQPGAALPSTAASASASASASTARELIPALSGKETSVQVAATKAAAVADAKPASKPEAASKAGVNAEEATRALAILEGKPTVAASPAKADKKSDKFVIQIAALATQEKVNQLRAKLSDAGVKSYTQKVPTQSGERIRVRVGPFSSRNEAEKMLNKLTKLGLSGKLVPSGAH